MALVWATLYLISLPVSSFSSLAIIARLRFACSSFETDRLAHHLIHSASECSGCPCCRAFAYAIPVCDDSLEHALSHISVDLLQCLSAAVWFGPAGLVLMLSEVQIHGCILDQVADSRTIFKESIDHPIAFLETVLILKATKSCKCGPIHPHFLCLRHSLYFFFLFLAAQKRYLNVITASVLVFDLVLVLTELAQWHCCESFLTEAS